MIRMAQAPIVGFLCVIACGCTDSATYHGVKIRGSEKFANQVQAALALINEKAPDEFGVISKYVRRIEEHDRSGMDASHRTCQLAPASTYYSLTWCAGVIAHEAHHAKLQSSPSYEYGLVEEERACNVFQASVMEKIGAPRDELDHLAKQDGTHFDANGDGEYTESDYEARDW